MTGVFMFAASHRTNCVRFVVMALFLIAHALVLPQAWAKPPAANLDMVQIIGAESADDTQTKITFSGILPNSAPLPCTTTFSLPTTFKLSTIDEADSSDGSPLAQAKYTTKKKGESLTYTVTLTKGRGIVAGFDLEGTIFDRSTQMGDSPIASLMFVPSSDLSRLVIGYVTPEKNYVAVGQGVQGIGKTEEGEVVYGITYENVKKGERQVATVAFTPKANRDEALARNAEEASAAAAAQKPYALTTSGLIVVIPSIVLVGALIAVVMLLRRGRGGE